MEIPQDFKDVIAEAFYDKDFIVYSKTNIIDAEGWLRDKENASGATIVCNIQFDNLEEIQQDYGLDEAIDAYITSATNIAVGTLGKYNGVLYRVIKSIPFDSHNLMLIREWQSKSST